MNKSAEQTGRLDISSQSGGLEVNQFLKHHWQEMNAVFRGRSIVMPNGLPHFGIILRGSGAIQDFGFEGPENISLSKKNGSISLDVGIPRHFWNQEGRWVAMFVCDSVRTSLPRISAVLDKRGFPHDRAALFDSISELLDEYIATKWSEV